MAAALRNINLLNWQKVGQKENILLPLETVNIGCFSPSAMPMEITHYCAVYDGQMFSTCKKLAP